ncbi:MAG: hypothetical protein KF718_05290 [Polyangiaceae bacterium]|nr:hypothetical protein [Polyangiaceae bacterium]
MRIPFPCLECDRDAGAPRQRVWAYGEISDTGIHSVSCPNGHDSQYRLVFEAPHELLLDVGALALLDGYLRECVSGFAAALEQSFEFFVEANLSARGVPAEEVRRLLSTNRRDQRRAGMISLCYLQETGRAFPFLQSKRAEFRNKVIHNASWPSREEVVDFARYVCDALKDLDAALGNKRAGLLQRMDDAANLEAAEITLAYGVAPTSIVRPNFYSMVRHETTFEDALARFGKEGWWKWPTRLHSAG